MQYNNSNTLEFRLADIAGEGAITTGPLSTGTWYQIPGVYDSSSNTGKIYVNADLEDSASTSGTLAYSGVNYLRLGSTTENNSTNVRFLDG